MLHDPVNNLQIKLLEGPNSLVNFALSKKFDEHLSLPRPGRLIWEELEYQRVITSQSVVQLPEHLPKGASGLSNVIPRKRRLHSLAVLLRVICFCESAGKTKLGW
jgi:hypothetical protein